MFDASTTTVHTIVLPRMVYADVFMIAGGGGGGMSKGGGGGAGGHLLKRFVPAPFFYYYYCPIVQANIQKSQDDVPHAWKLHCKDRNRWRSWSKRQ